MLEMTSHVHYSGNFSGLILSGFRYRGGGGRGGGYEAPLVAGSKHNVRPEKG